MEHSVDSASPKFALRGVSRTTRAVARVGWVARRRSRGVRRNRLAASASRWSSAWRNRQRGAFFARLFRFGLVGASGLVVNTLVLFALICMFRLWYVPAAFLASQLALAWNFALTERFVFAGRAHGRSLLARASGFLAMSNAAFALTGPTLYVLVAVAGMHYLAANVLSITLFLVARFLVADRVIWRSRSATGALRREAG